MADLGVAESGTPARTWRSLAYLDCPVPRFCARDGEASRNRMYSGTPTRTAPRAQTRCNASRPTESVDMRSERSTWSGPGSLHARSRSGTCASARRPATRTTRRVSSWAMPIQQSTITGSAKPGPRFASGFPASMSTKATFPGANPPSRRADHDMSSVKSRKVRARAARSPRHAGVPGARCRPGRASGQTMPSFFIRNRSVLGWIRSRSAALFTPLIRHPHSCRTLSMCAR